MLPQHGNHILFIIVTNNKIDIPKNTDVFRIGIDITSDNNDRGFPFFSTGPRYDIPTGRIGSTRHRTGVDYIQVGRLIKCHSLKTAPT
jgi:hypothetical protein